MSDTIQRAEEVLRKVFGYKAFLSIQAEIISHVMAGRDALVVMPTGGGKSLCYQIPALLFEGLTVVVSPLISLMNDQLEQLRQNGVDAVQLNSTLAYPEYRCSVEQIKTGRAKLLYVAPETLLKESLLDFLGSAAVDCLAIDEAHCISEWGHDFRPEYRRLAEVRRRLPKAVCVALTATATEQVRRDIKKSLGFGENAEFIAGFDRPNLFLQAAVKDNPYRQTLHTIRRHPDQPGIIYCATRKTVDRLAETLVEDGIKAMPYHAGLSDTDRNRHQQSFSRDDIQVMVATIAFGMGIDKSNVRFVIHYDLPKNIESYYQEIGRAGRDGMEAYCLLLYSYADTHKLKFMISRMDEQRQRTSNLLLGAMLRYVETDVCRRRVLLDYFGECDPREACGMCDNCLAGKKETQDLSMAAQKLLSCVKRTGESFGVEYVVDVLRGSKTQRIAKRGHDRLSTYGIGLEYSRNQWRHLARQLLHQGFMIQDLEYGGLQLTQKAWELFRGRGSFHGLLPAEISLEGAGKAPPSAGAPGESHDAALFELLRRKRKQLADEGRVPPFVIFSDKTLMEMAARYPQSKDSLLQVNGVGKVKEQKYGSFFLDILRRYCAENGIAERLSPGNAIPKVPSAGAGGKKRHQEIGEAFNNGRCIPELMEQYRIKHATVVDHLYRYWQDGNSLQCRDLPDSTRLNEEEQRRVLDAFDRLGYEALRPVYDSLDKTVGYDDLHLLRLCYLSTRLPKGEHPKQASAREAGWKQIICLANSRKFSGRCIAGKEWVDGKVGKWVRPVSDADAGELCDIDVGSGKAPRLMDLLTVPLGGACPHDYQTENCFIAGKSWRRIGAFPTSRLEDLLDDVDTLWINGYHSYSGRNDRIPLETAKTANSSLLFIRPQECGIVVAEGADLLKKVRARFHYKKEIYNLRVTDPEIEACFIARPLGSYPLESDSVFLTISISEPYEGFCYKLVAAVVNSGMVQAAPSPNPSHRGGSGWV